MFFTGIYAENLPSWYNAVDYRGVPHYHYIPAYNFPISRNCGPNFAALNQMQTTNCFHFFAANTR